MEKAIRNSKTVLSFILVVITIIIWYVVFYFESRQNLLVTFFDVGQGDSIFIEVPGGNQILIDGGPDDSVLAKLGKRMPFWDRSLDLVILTHPEKDHVSGLLEVLRRYDVDKILWTGVEHSIAEFEEWKKLLEKEDAEIFYAQRGGVINFGKGAEMVILWPDEDFRGKTVSELNETGVVAKLEYGQNSFLFTGDIGRSTEYRLLSESLSSKFFVLSSDVLKVGHHGSKYSSSDAFLRAVLPEINVIQSGRKNRYGHPASETLDRLAAAGAAILRNDTDGDIVIESNGWIFWRK
ncbi:MAG: MBL fold metallo-hydrolase [Candidatus Sungbacteria bacterium]|nr:MBL fold metallo-hydrolase [Candidatus Sungbacteria bacterium]